MKRFHWGYFTPTNGVITYKESWKKHHYSIKHLRVELELKGTTKNNTDFGHTHTHIHKHLPRSLDTLPLLEKKAMCYASWSFSQSNLGSTKKSLGNTYVFDAGIWPGRFPTNIVVFPEKKQNKTSFPKVPNVTSNGMTHPSSWYLWTETNPVQPAELGRVVRVKNKTVPRLRVLLLMFWRKSTWTAKCPIIFRQLYP